MLKINTTIIPHFKNRITSVFSHVKNPCLLRTPIKDIFISTQNININKNISEEKVKELYNEVYDEVIAQNIENNPILKEIKINKPEIEFDNLDKESIANYSYTHNTITFNTRYADLDLYAMVSYNKDGQLDNAYWLGHKKDLKSSIKKGKEINPDIKIIKLNNNEKEIYLKCVFAHELRHCIQAHLVLSSEDGYKDVKKHLKELLDSLEEIIGKSAQSNSVMSKYKNLYIFTYKPKKILDKKAKFKISLDKNNNSYWSIYDDFVKSNYQKLSKGKFDEDKYLSNVQEIDAYRYEYEYSMSKIKDWKKANARNEFLLSLLESFLINFNR